MSFRLAGVFVGCAGLGCAFASGQVENAASQPVAAVPADRLIMLNEAIAKFDSTDREDRDNARKLFLALSDESEAPELQLPANYYLALDDLSSGLSKVASIRELLSSLQTLKIKLHNAELEGRSADRAALLVDLKAKESEVDAQKATLRAEAQDSFKSARGRLEKVTQLIEALPEGSGIDVLRSGLLLGISQLASDAQTSKAYSASEKFESEALAERVAREAERTLADYVATEEGRGDRFGHFYLAVSRYRLANELLSGRTRSPSEAARVLAQAFGNLDTAGALAEKELTDDAQKENWAARVGYYRALLFIQRRQYGDYQSSIDELQRVLGILRDDDNMIRPSAQEVLNKLNEISQAGPDTEPIQIAVPGPIGPLEFDAKLSVGNGFDSNVILQGRDTALPRSLKRSDDYFAGVGFDFNISRYLSKRELGSFGESLTVGIGGYVANRWQPNISEFDVGTYGGRAFANWQPVEDLYVGLQYDYSYTTLDRDPFISSNRLTPSVSYVWRQDKDRKDPDLIRSELGRTDLYYVWDDRNYFDFLRDNRLDRDGEYHLIGLSHRFNLILAENYLGQWLDTLPGEKRRLFGRQWLSFQVGYNYRNERTVGDEFDMHSHGFAALLTVPLPYRLLFEISGEWSWDNYGHRSVFDFERKERFDFVQTYAVGLTYVIVARGEGTGSLRTLDVRLRGGIQLTIQDSNIWDRLGQDIYEYNREIYGIGLEIRF